LLFERVTPVRPSSLFSYNEPISVQTEPARTGDGGRPLLGSSRHRRPKPAVFPGDGLNSYPKKSDMLNNPKTYLKGAVHKLVVRPLGEKMQQLVDQNQHLMSRVDRLVQQNEDLLGQFDPLLTRFRQLVEGKREMIDYIGKMFPFESFADLGGAWTEPEGGYTFYTLERYRI